MFFPVLEDVLQNTTKFSFSLSHPPSLFFLSLCLTLKPVLMKVLLPVRWWVYLFHEPVPMCHLIGLLFPLLPSG